MPVLDWNLVQDKTCCLLDMSISDQVCSMMVFSFKDPMLYNNRPPAFFSIEPASSLFIFVGSKTYEVERIAFCTLLLPACRIYVMFANSSADVCCAFFFVQPQSLAAMLSMHIYSAQ
jgi:hypothetical protein